MLASIFCKYLYMDICSLYFNNYGDDDVYIPIDTEDASGIGHFRYVVDRLKETVEYFIGKKSNFFIDEGERRIRGLLSTIKEDNNYIKGYSTDFKCLKEYPDDYILESFDIVKNSEYNTLEITISGRPANKLCLPFFYSEKICLQMK